MDYMEQIKRNREHKCDYCGERQGLYYFRIVDKHCCSKTVMGCPGAGDKYRSIERKNFTRPESAYRQALASIERGEVKCYYCGEDARYYASGKYICERVAYDCPNYKNWLKEKQDAVKDKRAVTNYNRRKATLAKYGVDIERAIIPDGPQGYASYLTRVKSLAKKNQLHKL